MARPVKRGLKYFNLDCDQEDNLSYVEAKHGITGYGIIIKLWKKIYGINGYYTEWTDKNIYLFAREINVDIEEIKDVIRTSVEEGIFNNDMLEKYSILTSRGIQKRYLKIVTEAKRRDSEIDEKFCLIPSLPPGKLGLTPEETPKFPEESTQSNREETPEIREESTQRKEKESKEYSKRVSKDTLGNKLPGFNEQEKRLKKEFDQFSENLPADTKEAWVSVKNWITTHRPEFIEPYACAWNIYASIFKVPSIMKINDSRRKKFRTRIQEQSFDFFEILSKARKSEFIKSSTFFCFDWIIENDSNYLKILEENYK